MPWPQRAPTQYRGHNDTELKIALLDSETHKEIFEAEIEKPKQSIRNKDIWKPSVQHKVFDQQGELRSMKDPYFFVSMSSLEFPMDVLWIFARFLMDL